MGTGKAKHPHNKKRPSPKAVKNAIAKGDMGALRVALSPRQRAFAEEYLIDFNASAAARRAGYSPNCIARQAHLLMRHEGVREYLDYLLKSQEAKIQTVDPDYVITKTTAIINKDSVRDGDALRGLELIAKILGMLKEKTEISGPDGQAIEIEQRTRQEVSELLTTLSALSKKAKKEIELVGGD